jgi:hypothetical protein
MQWNSYLREFSGWEWPYRRRRMVRKLCSWPLRRSLAPAPLSQLVGLARMYPNTFLSSVCWLLKLRQMGTQGVHMEAFHCKGSFHGWFVGLVVPLQEFLFCIGCSSRPSTKYNSPHRTLLVLISQQAGQAIVSHRLFLCVSGLTPSSAWSGSFRRTYSAKPAQLRMSSHIAYRPAQAIGLTLSCQCRLAGLLLRWVRLADLKFHLKLPPLYCM